MAAYTVTVLGSTYEIAGVTIASQPRPVAPSVAAVDMTVASQPRPVAPSVAAVDMTVASQPGPVAPLNPEIGAVTAPAAPPIPFPARIASGVGVAWPESLTVHGQAVVILG